jgi:hypothetical protein
MSDVPNTNMLQRNHGDASTLQWKRGSFNTLQRTRGGANTLDWHRTAKDNGELVQKARQSVLQQSGMSHSGQKGRHMSMNEDADASMHTSRTRRGGVMTGGNAEKLLTLKVNKGKHRRGISGSKMAESEWSRERKRWDRLDQEHAKREAATDRKEQEEARRGHAAEITYLRIAAALAASDRAELERLGRICVKGQKRWNMREHVASIDIVDDVIIELVQECFRTHLMGRSTKALAESYGVDRKKYSKTHNSPARKSSLNLL